MNQEIKKVSIIVPVYNVEKYLDQCIQSIINQTYRNLEIFLVNDGSTDKSGELCNIWSKYDTRIHVIHQTNQGVSVARNVALDQITGQYLLFIDSDDWIEKFMVERLVSKIETEVDIDAVFCGYVEFEDDSNKNLQIVSPSLNRIIDRNSGVAEIFGEYSTMVWNKLFSTKLLNEMIYFDTNLKIGEDELWMIQTLKTAKNISLIDDPLYHYRKRTVGVSKDFTLSLARLSEISSQKQVLQEIVDYRSEELLLLAQKRMYYTGQLIMKIAFYQGDIELFQKIDRDIDNVRQIWYAHHRNYLGKCRRKLVETMMRNHFPACLVKIFDK